MGFVPTGHRPIKSRHFYQAGDNDIFIKPGIMTPRLDKNVGF
jgi:hypothetical protein